MLVIAYLQMNNFPSTAATTWCPFASSYHICIRTLIPSITSVFILKSTPVRDKRYG